VVQVVNVEALGLNEVMERLNYVISVFSRVY